MKLSRELKLELTRWLSDATSSEPTNLVQMTGLCGYVDINVRQELMDIFRDLHYQGIHRSKHFPFDRPGEFCIAACESRMHLNPKRLAWVRSVLDVT